MKTSKRTLLKTLFVSTVGGGLALLLLVTGTLAAPPPDAYADAVQASSNFNNPGNAVGPPDGARAFSLVNLSPSSITLDMGADEEGTGDLLLHYSVVAGVNVTVQFLNESLGVISSQSVSLALLSSSTTVTYASAPTPYRYVRISIGLGLAVGIDAVEALNYVTPTATASFTPSHTASLTPSPTPSDTATLTPSLTPSPTMTHTETATLTPSDTASLTPSDTPTLTPSDTATHTATETATLTPSETATLTPSETASLTATETLTATASHTHTPTSTASNTPAGYTPYANEVLGTSGVVGNAAFAVGGPDGACASMTGVAFLDAVLTLDMGAGEEEQGDLMVYYQGNLLGIGAASLPQVQFLDESLAVIATAPAPLLQLVLGDTVAIYTYPAAPADYRYVRLTSGLLSLLCVDAVEAIAYVPPTATSTATHTSSPSATLTPSLTSTLTSTPSSTLSLTPTASAVYSPHAAAVHSSAGTVSNAAFALGAPDGACASLTGVLFLEAILTLDMGHGEEEQTDLMVHYQGDLLGLGAAALPQVEFLDESLLVISIAPAPLLQLVAGNTTATYSYHGAPAAYRYVRLSSGLLSLLCVDAVEAVGAAAPPASSTPTPTHTHTLTETPAPARTATATALAATSTPQSATATGSNSPADVPSATSQPPSATAPVAAFLLSSPTVQNSSSAAGLATSLPSPSLSPTHEHLARIAAGTTPSPAVDVQSGRTLSGFAIQGLWSFIPWAMLSLILLVIPGMLVTSAPRLRIMPVHAREAQGFQKLYELGLVRRYKLKLQIRRVHSPTRAVAEFLNGRTDVLLGSLHDIVGLAESGADVRIIYVHGCRNGSLRMAHALHVMAVAPHVLKARGRDCSRLMHAWNEMAEQEAAAPRRGFVLLGRRANRLLMAERGGARMRRLLADTLGPRVTGDRVHRLLFSTAVRQALGHHD